MKKILKISITLVMLAVIASTMLVPAFAAFPWPDNQKGSIVFNLYDPEQPGKLLTREYEFTIFKVGDVVETNGSYNFQLDANMRARGLVIEDLEKPETGTIISQVIDANPGAYTGIAKKNSLGTFLFDNLDLGVYLVRQTVTSPGYNINDPFCVIIPSSPKGRPEFNVVVTPKVIVTDYINVIIKKVWNAGEGVVVPTEVTMQLLKNNQPINTVVLNASNNWAHQWVHLRRSDNIEVREINIPTNFVVSYTTTDNGTLILITATNSSKLPQTGQLNWPVPILAGAGVALILVGFLLTKKKSRDENIEDVDE